MTLLVASSATPAQQQCGENLYVRPSVGCQHQTQWCLQQVMLHRCAVLPIVARMLRAAQQLPKSLKSSPAHLDQMRHVHCHPKAWRTNAKIARQDTIRTALGNMCADRLPKDTLWKAQLRQRLCRVLLDLYSLSPAEPSAVYAAQVQCQTHPCALIYLHVRPAALLSSTHRRAK